MAHDLPLEIIYQIMDELALPAHPLAYELIPSSRQALLSLNTVCKATHLFASRLLYSHVCITSAHQLFRLMSVAPTYLGHTHSLYINLENVKQEFAESDRIQSYLPWKEMQARRSDSYGKLADCLCRLLQSVFPSLHRLVLYARFGSPHLSLSEEFFGLELRAVLSFYTCLRPSLIDLVPRLTELHLRTFSPYIIGRGVHYDWPRLERISLCDEYAVEFLREQDMPLLKSFVMFPLFSEDREAFDIDSIINELPCLRTFTLLFDGVEKWVGLNQLPEWRRKSIGRVEVFVVDLNEMSTVNVLWWRSKLNDVLQSGRLWNLLSH